MLAGMERLRRYLEEEGISQAELARRAGVSQPTVWEWLNGHSLPSADSLRTLSRVTGVSIDELLAPAKKIKSSELRA
jgi:transcriptional regulator with XRE-family HTH domain